MKIFARGDHLTPPISDLEFIKRTFGLSDLEPTSHLGGSSLYVFRSSFDLRSNQSNLLTRILNSSLHTARRVKIRTGIGCLAALCLVYVVNTLPITKKIKHTVVAEAPKKCMCCFRASKFSLV